MQLICAFFFTYAKSRFSHDVAHFMESIVTIESFQTEVIVNSADPDQTAINVFIFLQHYQMIVPFCIDF